jgi:peptidoglycan/xylan/chitin deacetylase (PgdA/CDA1 family)
MRTTVKRFLATVTPPAEAEGWRVLLYHAIEEPSPEDRLGLRVSPEAFREQMVWLKDEGFTVVPLTALAAGPAQPRTVAITFDDGYASQVAAAAILEEFGFPATFFVVPAFLDGRAGHGGYWERWGYFGWGALQTLAACGFEVGAHSTSHGRLTRCRTVRELEEETLGAKQRLEAMVHRPVSSFSYPHGAFNDTVARAVEQAGYRLACTSLSGVNRPPCVRFALRRTEITGFDRLSDFAMKLSGKYDWLQLWQRWQLARA